MADAAALRIVDRISAKTKLFGVVGRPIAHSLSPQIHNTLAAELGADLVYTAFAPAPEAVRTAFSGLFAAGVSGLNVTMPFKGDAYAFADVRHGEAERFSAANTLVLREGAIHAYNTDFDGFVNAFTIQTGADFAGKRVAILGAGASCRTLSHAIAAKGAAAVAIVSRSPEKAGEVAENCRARFPACRFETFGYADAAARTFFGGCDVIVNTTPVGMGTNQKILPGGLDFPFQSAHFVVDLIYSPKETFFLWSARRAGAVAINGLGMLICQAAIAFTHFTGIPVHEALLAQMFERFQGYVEARDTHNAGS
ncbi:MAG: shikimate dehydrogenase [Clostridiales bacterium]|jgi:shikimate dehydrogenase|nr:shikimate dehydrogenase [Clostridiales bacterium]